MESENKSSERINQPAEEKATTVPQAQNPNDNALVKVMSNVAKGMCDRINKVERINGEKRTKYRLKKDAGLYTALCNRKQLLSVKRKP